MKVREIYIPDNRPFIVRVADYKPSRDFNPPMTLGKPMGKTEEAKKVMAMDACIKNVLSNFRDELHTCGTPMFVGYGMLSSISQEALIRAGVETIADEMTRKFMKFRYDVDDGHDNHEQEISDLEEQAAKFKLKDIFNDAAQKDGYFGGCLVYIDVGELDDEEALEPLVLDKKTFKKGMLKGFKVIEPINVYPGEYNTTDPTDEHYFNPEYWYILGRRYHASRFLYFVGNSVPVLLKPAYNFFGIARAQLALDYIAHFVENRESAQELLNKFSLTCWKTDMSQVLAGESCNDLVKRVRMFNKMKSNNGTLVVDKEQEDIMQINTPLGGVRDIVDMSLSLLTAVWRIPKIKYIGEGEGGLNASSKEQMRSFYDFILSQKEKMFTEPMETVLKILQLNMGKDINESIGFEFPSLVEMDDSEIAQLNKLKADTAVQLINAGVVSQEEVRQNLSMDKNSGFSMIDVDDIPEEPEQPNEKEVVEVEDEDLVMDERWITIGHKDSDEDGEGGRKGRHILLKEGEKPVEAVERTIKKDIDGNGKIGKLDAGTEKGGEKPVEKKPSEEKLEENKSIEKKTEESSTGTMGYKNVNKGIKEFIRIKKEKQEAHRILNEKEGEYKAKLQELRDKSEEYKKASYDYDHYEEIAKEKGIQEYMVLRDASAIKRKLDLEFSQQAYKSIDGMFEARQKINNFEESSKAWSDGVNEIQSKIKERILEVSKENEKIADAITNIENKVPEYKENLKSLWKEYTDKKEQSDWAAGSLAYGEYVEKASAVKKKMHEEKENFAKRVGEALRVKDGQSVGFSKSGISGLEERFKSVFDGVLGKGMLEDNEKPVVVKRKCRAHQNGETLTLSGDTDIQTAIHEFMHYVEGKNPQMLANSVAFLRYRTGDEKLKSLKKLTGISYGSGEKARADKFFDAYCGKIYSFTDDYLHSRATEIMSMGVQELFTNPAKFRKEDPEYFNFVIANLRGTL